MKRRRHWSLRAALRWAGIIALLAVAALVAARLDPAPAPLTGNAYAADGDTLHLGADRIRLLGIDAPELHQMCWDADDTQWACGQQAKALLSRLIAAGSVRCAPTQRDKFSRWLATCAAGGQDLGRQMIAAGLAVSYDDYKLDELAARAAKKGMWAGRFDQPRTWRDDGPSAAPRQTFLDWLLGVLPR